MSPWKIIWIDNSNREDVDYVSQGITAETYEYNITLDSLLASA